MFEKVLFGKTKNILALLGKSGLLEGAYLAGGTACALHLGHRISYDFYYSYPLLFRSKKFEGIKIADLRDIAAMKIAAIAERGTKRDFIDLYMICQKISLKKTLSLYNRKYGKLTSNLVHIIKSLTYFEDAEKDVMPKMLVPISWGEVKSFFQKETKRLAKNYFLN